MSSNVISQNPIFAPTQVSGCSLWLDAADPTSIALSGSSVTQWNDKSGNGRTFAQATSSNQPIYVSNSWNSLPVLQFSTSFLSNAGFSLYNSASSGAAVFAIFKTTNVNQQSQLLEQLNSGGSNNWTEIAFSVASGPSYSSNNYGAIGYHRGNGSVTQTASNAIANNINYLYSGTLSNSGTTPTSVGLFINGSQQTSIDSTTGVDTGFFSPGSYPNTNTAGISIGARLIVGSYNYFAGDMGEMIYYNSAITTTQRQLVEGYLAWKWGLTSSLPSNHPYKNTPVYSTSVLPPSLRANVPVSMTPSSSPFTFFNPTSIPGCILWLDPADTSVFTGGANWIDKSGTSNTGITGTPPTTSMPTITRWNGLQSARFLAANKTSVKTTNTITNMPVTYFMAARSQASSFGRFLINNLDGQRQIVISPPAVTASGGVNINIINAGIGQEFQMCVTFSTGATVGYANGSQSGASGTASTSAPSQNYFGSDNGDGGYLSADLGDILIYNSVLSGSQRQLVEGYLAWKWGLSASLPSNHPFKNTPPGLAVPSVPLRLAMNNRSFSPTAISNCILWLDASDRASFTLSGNTLASIQDKSPTAKTITVNSAPTYNSTIFNTFPGFVFASGNRLSAPTSALGSSMTLIAVYCITSNVTSVPLSVGLNGNETGIGFNSFYAYYNIYDNGVNESGNTRYTTINTNLIHIGVKSPTTPNLTSYVSGISSTPVNSGYSNANTTIYISGGFSFIGNLAESIVYSSALSLPQVQQVEGYLAWKWGLVGSLPANHPYKKWPPPPN